jgi:lipoprotein-anchoring transpeptidase ErfK/SrfK
MSLRTPWTGIALAAVAVLTLIAAPQRASAQGFDFLWGGSAEYGGGRQVISFNPQYKPGQVIVSFSDRRLYFITKQGEAITYPVAVPTGEARWQGVTFVSDKKVNPAWTPTPDMVAKNPRLPRWVPGGHPMNPLGIRAMYLGSSAYRIHGTDAPWTIGQAVSHGCIRMTNEDVLDLYPRIPVGTRVTVTWQRFSGSGAVASDSSSSNSYASEGGDPRRYYRPAGQIKRYSRAASAQ